MVQQIYYACQWRDVSRTSWIQAKLSKDIPSLAYGPLFTGFNLALYEIQFVIYSIIAVFVFCWSVALLKGVYNLKFKLLAHFETSIALGSKIFAVVAPALLTGLSFLPSIQKDAQASLAMNIILILTSYGIGGVLVCAVLVRYIYSRHLFSSMLSSSTNHATTVTDRQTPRAPKIRIDKVLLVRFSIAFFILAAFEVTIICFEFTRVKTAARLADAAGPDYSVDGAIMSILLFMPGVTGSLLAFLLFGTTAHYCQKYVAVFKSMACVRRRRPSLSLVSNGQESWSRLESGAPNPMYRCTVNVGRDSELELDNTAPFGKVRTSVVVQDAGEASETELFGEEAKDRRSWKQHGQAR
ncbi:hypothetical protein LTR62_003618 [Meristemomyces frigidus]|uniref:Uncharacterized protein n=1 Tax=Meristemomyces frigidus TaxID=1508187 RepID=A0AAN7TP96_9PEZI|nr:hypothetical protein LTR62_003618 [Meristemomyces frigidus]